ncbi:MAG: helix-turn-helix domain-containing protein [Sciscionella sp.]
MQCIRCTRICRDGFGRLTCVHGSASDDAADPRRQAFGQRLRGIRLRAGLTQEAVARDAGLHRVFYGRVESGTENISIDNVFKIADVLHVDVGDLFVNLVG